MTRLRMSRPKRSVPNHALGPGRASMRSKFGSSGAYGAMAPAKAATPTTTSATSAPATTTPLRVTRRTRRPHRRPCGKSRETASASLMADGPGPSCTPTGGGLWDDPGQLEDSSLAQDRRRDWRAGFERGQVIADLHHAGRRIRRDAFDREDDVAAQDELLPADREDLRPADEPRFVAR